MTTCAVLFNFKSSGFLIASDVGGSVQDQGRTQVQAVGTRTVTAMDVSLSSMSGALAMGNHVPFEDCAERCAQPMDTGSVQAGARLEASEQEGGLQILYCSCTQGIWGGRDSNPRCDSL
jgi:hypothetical protein